MSSTPLFDSLEHADIQDTYDPEARLVLYPGDANDLLKAVPDESVQLVVTSPPYNIGKEYETRVDLEAYLSKQFDTIKELHRILHPTGSICWQVGNYIEEGEVYPLDILYYPFFKELGMQLRNRIVWHFGHGLHATRRLSGRYETLLWFSKSGDYQFNLDAIRVPAKYPGKRAYKGPRKGELSGNPKGKNPSDVWDILLDDWESAFWDIPNTKSNHPEKTIHPAQFPIALVERCVLAFTDEDDWVFDPYAGVGSALVAALKHGRRALGAELEPSYVEIARQRIRDYYSGSLRYRPLGRAVYKPDPKSKLTQVPIEWQIDDDSAYGNGES